MSSIDFSEEFAAKIPALTLIANLGYQYLTPQQCGNMRTNNNKVILNDILTEFLQQQQISARGKTFKLSDHNITKIINEFNNFAMEGGLISTNKKIHEKLVYGHAVSQTVDGQKVDATIKLIDWHNPTNNYYHVTEEMPVTANTATRIPDIVCFVNGLPLVVIEAKKPTAKNTKTTRIEESISQQIRNQKPGEIPQLFIFSQLLLAIDGYKAKYATCSTPEKFWAIWQEQSIALTEQQQIKNKKVDAQQRKNIFSNRKQHLTNYLELTSKQLTVTEQDSHLIALLSPDRLLKLCKRFTIFHQDQKIKRIIARYHQFFGVEKTIERLTSFGNDQARPDARNGGVIWHTTGSGKSFTMVFVTQALLHIKQLAKCSIIVVTDRKDLEQQIFTTFKHAGELSSRDCDRAKATTKKDLIAKIKANQPIIFSIINKFAEITQTAKCLNPSKDIIVLVDEAHRSHQGETNIQMQNALPNAAFIGFTGTPLLKNDATVRKFGGMIHSYTMEHAVADKIVTPLIYEQRMSKLEINSAEIDSFFNRFTEKFTEEKRRELKRKLANKNNIYQADARLELIAYDICDHFKSFKAQGMRAQLACDSKKMAICYQQLFAKIGEINTKVVISAPDTREGHDDVTTETQDIVQKWWLQNIGKQQEEVYTKQIIKEFKADDGNIDLLIVVDKLLTGFDEPKNAVLYIDKPLKNQNIIQAVARVNRIHKHKKFGYLIDYRGVLKDLDMAIAKYKKKAEETANGFNPDDLTGLYNAMATEYKKLPQLHTKLWDIFKPINNKQDGAALRQLLAPQIDPKTFIDSKLKLRNDFYNALRNFAQCLAIAVQSQDYFQDTFFDDKRQTYKNTLATMNELRKQVIADSSEDEDDSNYEDAIKVFINKNISGITVEKQPQIHLHKLNKDIDINTVSETEAKTLAAQIESKLAKHVESLKNKDSYAYEKLSELLTKALQAIESKKSAIDQLVFMQDVATQITEPQIDGIPYDLLNKLTDKQQYERVHAYYGLFLKHLGQKLIIDNNKQLTVEQCFDYVLNIDTIIEQAIAENSLNQLEAERQINQNIFSALHENLALDTLDIIDIIIADIIKNIRLRLDK